MYKVHVHKVIWSCPKDVVDRWVLNVDEEDAPEHTFVTKKLSLPFAPYKGLEIREGHTGYSLTDVIWMKDEEYFHCQVKDEFAFADAPTVDSVFSYDELLRRAESAGWETETDDWESGVWKIDGLEK